MYVHSEITQDFLYLRIALSSVIASPLCTATNKNLGKIKSVLIDRKKCSWYNIKKGGKIIDNE